MGVRDLLADTRPLANNHFRRLWQANIITLIGAQLTVVAVPAQIYAITGSSAYVGLTGVFGLVPLLVFGLWGGALADAHDRRKILLVTTSGLILTAVGFWAQAASGLSNVWLLLGLFAVQQAFFAVNQPARTSLLPELIDDELLPAANALNMTIFSAGAIAGPMIGGALIPIIGYSWLYLLDAISLLFTWRAVALLPPLPVAGGGTSPGLAAIWEGLGYLRHHPVLLMSFVVDLIAMVFGMPRALFPELAHIDFGGPEAGGMAFALLMAGLSVGGVVGGVLSGWVSRVSRQGLAVVVAIAVWGLAMVGFGVAAGLAGGRETPMLWIALLMLVIGGAADMASAAFRQSMLLSAATPEVRGRLQGVFFVVVVGGPRVADVLHGFAAAWVGAAAAAAGGGVLVVVGVIAAALAVPVFIRHAVRPATAEAGEA